MSYPYVKEKMEYALKIVMEQLERYEKEMEYLGIQGGYDTEIETIRTQEIPHLLFVKERFSKSLERIY
jgi:hypothetical protein